MGREMGRLGKGGKVGEDNNKYLLKSHMEPYYYFRSFLKYICIFK